MTYCTGNRTSIRLRSLAMWTFSRWCSRLGPSYQDIVSERVTMLSPLSAEMGIAVRSGMRSLLANAANSSLMSSNTCCEKSTRSILLTQSTRCGTCSSVVRKACLRLCSRMPLRASTSTIARSAVDAPVTMLRVYCVWPGVSAMMNLRLGVAK